METYSTSDGSRQKLKSQQIDTMFDLQNVDNIAIPSPDELYFIIL